MTWVHVQSDVLHLHFLGKSAAEMSVVWPWLTSMQAGMLKAWWDLLAARGLVVPAMTPGTLRSACSCMVQFLLHCPDDPALITCIVLVADRAASHFREKATFVQPLSPLAIDGSDVWSDDEKRKQTEEWRLFEVTGDIQLSHLCEVGATLEVVADVSDLRGDFSTLEAVTNTSKLFQRVADVLFYVPDAKKKKVGSTLQRARDLSSRHFREALVKRIRLAFKAPGYRSNPVDPELRFAEFGRLLDLDGDSEEVQQFVNQIIEYSSGEAVEMENAATDVSKAEELDVAERGRDLTKAELAEFTLMRTHALSFGSTLFRMLPHCSWIARRQDWATQSCSCSWGSRQFGTSSYAW